MRLRAWIKRSRTLLITGLALLSVAAAGMANWPNH